MQQYKAPLSDMQFLLEDVFQIDKFWSQNNQLKQVVDVETARAMLEEAGKLIGEQVSPINRSGDEEGVSWSADGVTTPAGFAEAFRLYSEGGWTSLCGNPAYGGMGMPKSLSVCVDEMLYGANSSFALYPALTAGACLAIEAHASEELRQLYLPKLYSGEWSGTMCLTEPHAGSDLGLINTKAIPEDDGTYSITGTKIFITGGDHDLTENIVHLVLAKLPDAPQGSRGISLFLVPKYKVDSAGKITGSNGVSCGAAEHKMGIHASATCVMNFDSAQGHLIGELNSGLKCMFTMMNYERLSIGIQGTGCSEMSYQNAVVYAKERLQGKDPSGKNTDSAAPIIVHPDVRRMLLTMKSTIEAGRALSIYLGQQLDICKFGEDEAERKQASALVALLTPVAKAFFTDMGLENTVLGQQIFGGHGYIREWGQEQLVRDVRIAQIYEGTNGIQAQDLILRKVFTNDGAFLNLFINEIQAFIDQLDQAELEPLVNVYREALTQLQDATQELLQKGKENLNELFAAANDYLHLLGHITYGYMWLRMLSAVSSSECSDEFKSTKLETGKFYFSRVLPRIHSLLATMRSGADNLMTLDADAF
ncbi:MAG: acyl-CoA dehydrogenase [Gammaproteobacteria bacterium]|nr:MAG: acyl-CoA dehydrogenase [Gammaproteobacteria bacterium]